MELSGFNPICIGLVVLALVGTIARSMVLYMVRDRHVQKFKKSMPISDWGYYGSINSPKRLNGCVKLHKPCSTDMFP